MAWNEHTQQISKWRGDDRSPLPTPCDDARCQFCGVWFGQPHERGGGYERRTAERAQAARG